jgi:hypothetical protein
MGGGLASFARFVAAAHHSGPLRRHVKIT